MFVREPSEAKRRLASALAPAERRHLAEECALQVLSAAHEVAPTLAVCGGPDAAWLAGRAGGEALVEDEPPGQNQAGARRLEAAAARGAERCLLLSADLPLADLKGLRRLVARAEDEEAPVAAAVPALGREGTPPRGYGLESRCPTRASWCRERESNPYERTLTAP